jgi:RNA polymerase sigma-70 factor (ECF subfamily)
MFRVETRKVSVRDELVLLTPRLRRYARALTQASPTPSEAADDLVNTTLLRTVDCNLPDRKSDLLLQLFSLLTLLNRENQQDRVAHSGIASCAAPGEEAPVRSGHPAAAPRAGLSAALAALKLEEREALFLVVVEGFNYAQAARILHISRSTLLTRLVRARGRLCEVLAGTGPQMLGRRAPHLRVVK